MPTYRRLRQDVPLLPGPVCHHFLHHLSGRHSGLHDPHQVSFWKMSVARKAWTGLFHFYCQHHYLNWPSFLSCGSGRDVQFVFGFILTSQHKILTFLMLRPVRSESSIPLILLLFSLKFACSDWHCWQFPIQLSDFIVWSVGGKKKIFLNVRLVLEVFFLIWTFWTLISRRLLQKANFKLFF